MSIKFWKHLNLTQIFDFSHFLSIFSTFPEKIKKIVFPLFLHKYLQISISHSNTWGHLRIPKVSTKSWESAYQVCKQKSAPNHDFRPGRFKYWGGLKTVLYVSFYTFLCSGPQIVILTMPLCSEPSSYSWKLLTDVWSDQNFCLENVLKKFTSENRPKSAKKEGKNFWTFFQLFFSKQWYVLRMFSRPGAFKP